jgi:peptide/nickel transport system permease protein
VLNFAARRVGFMLIALLGVVTLSFLLLHFVPGDPVEIMLGEQAPPADKENLRQALGLDLPISLQYTQYLKNLTHFDLGRSITMRTPVSSEIAKHFPATVELALTALLLAILWGLPAGVFAAVRKGGARDYAAGTVALLGMSVPGVFLGPLLIYIFAIQLDWFPVSDRGGLAHLVLPACSLALPLGAVILRMTRAAVLDVLNEDYIRTARSKGLGNMKIYFKHALRNALIPIVTIIGLQLSALLTGTVVTETIFDWPGIGSLVFTAIQRRDYPLVQGCVLFVATIYVLVNLLTDLMYGVVNPKVRAEAQ